MQIVTDELKGHTNEYPLSRLGRREEILALDIETTGLAPDRSRVWLIGCAYWEEDSWRQIQWFDETGNDEADILTSFLLFSKRFRVLLTYNGDSFDLPFLSRRIIHHGLQAMSGTERFPSSMKSVDLLRCLRPYKEVLSLPNLQQQTVERFAATGRTESLSGSDLAGRYLAYIAGTPIMADDETLYAAEDPGQNTIPATGAPDSGDLTSDRIPAAATPDSSAIKTETETAEKASIQNGSADNADNKGTAGGAGTKPAETAAPAVFSRRAVRTQFLEHNAADTAGLLALSDLLIYSDLFAAELTVYKAQANVCRDAFGNPSQELLLYARMKSLPAGTGEVLSRTETAQEDSAPSASQAKDSVPLSDPFRITTQADSCYLAIHGSRVTIRIPIFNGRLHYYYANYKDYYYLPALDQAIHKSIATFVEKDRRVQATRETCYTSKDGSFLPEWTRLHEPYYRKEARDRTVWFEFTPELKRSREFFTEYANYIYRHILEAHIG